ncbi:MAG: hypothetical protein WC812_02250 [Candidatus Pacearchaeota archaeon]|jgi:chromosome segregation ATPase
MIEDLEKKVDKNRENIKINKQNIVKNKKRLDKHDEKFDKLTQDYQKLVQENIKLRAQLKNYPQLKEIVTGYENKFKKYDETIKKIQEQMKGRDIGDAC